MTYTFELAESHPTADCYTCPQLDGAVFTIYKGSSPMDPFTKCGDKYSWMSSYRKSMPSRDVRDQAAQGFRSVYNNQLPENYDRDAAKKHWAEIEAMTYNIQNEIF